MGDSIALISQAGARSSHEAAYLSAQRELAERAMAAVMLDLEYATGLRPVVTVDLWRNRWIRIVINRGYTTPSMTARNLPDALVEVAEYFQEQVDRICWPTCPAHDVGLHAEVRNFLPVWWCRVGDHAVATIGSLGG